MRSPWGATAPSRRTCTGRAHNQGPCLREVRKTNFACGYVQVSRALPHVVSPAFAAYATYLDMGCNVGLHWLSIFDWHIEVKQATLDKGLLNDGLQVTHHACGSRLVMQCGRCHASTGQLLANNLDTVLKASGFVRWLRGDGVNDGTVPTYLPWAQ